MIFFFEKVSSASWDWPGVLSQHVLSQGRIDVVQEMHSCETMENICRLTPTQNNLIVSIICM